MTEHHKGLKCDGSSLSVNEARDSKVGCLVLGKEREDTGKCEAAIGRQRSWSSRQGTKARICVITMVLTIIIEIITIAPSKAQNIYR